MQLETLFGAYQVRRHEVLYVAEQPGEPGIGEVAWPRQVNVDQLFDDRARADRHDGNAIREYDCLGDVVCNEHDGLADALPDVEQYGVHAPAGERIQRRK